MTHKTLKSAFVIQKEKGSDLFVNERRSDYGSFHSAYIFTTEKQANDSKEMSGMLPEIVRQVTVTLELED